MSSILHIAWLGTNNYGDNVMKEALYEFLSKKYGHNVYLALCKEKPPLETNTSWVYPEFINTKWWQKFWNNKFIRKIDFKLEISNLLIRPWENKALRKSELFIIGGGSILHSSKGIRSKYRLLLYFKKTGKKKAVGIGLSLGPFSSKEEEALSGELLKNLDSCSFRDKASYELAKTFKLPYEPILAFDLAGAYVDSNKIYPRSDIEKIETVGLSIRVPWKSDYQLTLLKYIDLLKKLSEKYSKVLLFAFEQKVGELEFCEKVFKTVPRKNINLVAYKGDDKKFTEKIKECDFVISSKLHGGVVAFLLNIPFTLISYQKKFEDFADYIQLPAQHRLKQTDFEIDRVIDSIYPYKLYDREKFISLSKKNFNVFNNI